MTRMTHLLFAAAMLVPVVGFATPTEALDRSAEVAPDLGIDKACDPGNAAESDLIDGHAQSGIQGAVHACFGLPSHPWSAFNLCSSGNDVCTAYNIYTGQVFQLRCNGN